MDAIADAEIEYEDEDQCAQEACENLEANLLQVKQIAVELAKPTSASRLHGNSFVIDMPQEVQGGIGCTAFHALKKAGLCISIQMDLWGLQLKISKRRPATKENHLIKNLLAIGFPQ